MQKAPESDQIHVLTNHLLKIFPAPRLDWKTIGDIKNKIPISLKNLDRIFINMLKKQSIKHYNKTEEDKTDVSRPIW